MLAVTEVNGCAISSYAHTKTAHAARRIRYRAVLFFRYSCQLSKLCAEKSSLTIKEITIRKECL